MGWDGMGGECVLQCDLSRELVHFVCVCVFCLVLWWQCTNDIKMLVICCCSFLLGSVRVII